MEQEKKRRAKPGSVRGDVNTTKAAAQAIIDREGEERQLRTQRLKALRAELALQTAIAPKP